MNRAFPSADISQWTGEQKLEAVHQVARAFDYMVIASPNAPETCFEFVEVVNTDTGESARAVVVDFTQPMTSDNMADVSQAVIDRLWGDSYIEGQRLPARVIYTGTYVPSFVFGRGVAAGGNVHSRGSRRGRVASEASRDSNQGDEDSDEGNDDIVEDDDDTDEDDEDPDEGDEDSEESAEAGERAKALDSKVCWRTTDSRLGLFEMETL
ncbi:MAG: hypothetical protein SGCHY_002703 [Lobulomycetales sp.]